MKNNDYKGLLDNIDISESAKQDLYENCINGKRTADFTFRYSQLLLVLIAVSLFSVMSIGAAAAVMSARERMENMSEEEYNSMSPDQREALESSTPAYHETITGPCPETLAKNLAKSRFLRHSYKATG